MSTRRFSDPVTLEATERASTRVDVAQAGGLERALRQWQFIAGQNQAALKRRRAFVGPSESRRLKARDAQRRRLRARARRERRQS